MKRTLILAPFALALATPAFAGPFGHQHHDGPIDTDKVMERADHALDEVDATTEQRATVRAIVEDTIPQMQSYRDEAGTLRDEIKAVFQAEQIDRSSLEGSRTDLVDLFDRATETMFATFADLAEVFSLDQRAELRQMREERRQAMRKRFGLDQ